MSLDPNPTLVAATWIIWALTGLTMAVWIVRVREPEKKRRWVALRRATRYSSPFVLLIAHFLLSLFWRAEASKSWLATLGGWMSFLSGFVCSVLLLCMLVAWPLFKADERAVEPRRTPGIPHTPPSAPRLTRGQVRYVMRHSTNFKMGNRRGKRPF